MRDVRVAAPSRCIHRPGLTSAWCEFHFVRRMWWSRSDGQSGGTPPVIPAKAIVSPLTTAITTHAWNGNFVRARHPDAVYASEQGRAHCRSMRTHPGGRCPTPETLSCEACRPVGHWCGVVLRGLRQV